MTRRMALALGIGLVGLLALLLVAQIGHAVVMPSYLAAWLFVFAVPAGALPLVMGYDLLRRPEAPILTALRMLLIVMPVAAILALPLLLDREILYPLSHGNGFAVVWKGAPLVLARSIAFLVIWVILALVFRRSPVGGWASSRRQGLAGLGFILHLVMGTLAAFDWIGAIDPGLNASGLGLLVLVAQAGTAMSLAWLLTPSRTAASAAGVAPAMLILLCAWLFLQFTQYLVVWSANLPEEVTWYLRRDDGFGAVAEVAAVMIFLVALVTLMRWPGPRMVTGVAAAILAMHLLEMLWLVVPASRGRLSLTLPDVLAIVGLGGLLFGAMQFGARAMPVGKGLDRGRA